MNPFAQTIGHKTAQDVLLRMFAHDRPPHALLFVGPSHVGKTHMAHALMRSLLQTDLAFEACADVSILKRDHDEKTGKHKSQISVTQVRLLVERLNLSSMNGKWKIAFIEEAHLFSVGAANALLKTLEEPKGQTLLILRAPSVESVLPTIASRCQFIRLSVVSREEIASALGKRGLSPTEARHLAARSLGRPGLALRYIQDGELRAQKELATDQVHTLFSANLYEQFQSVMGILPKAEADKARVLARVLDDWSEVLRDDLLHAIGCNGWCFDQADAPKVSVEKTTHALRRVQEVRDALRHHSNPHLALEHLFL